MDTTIESFPFCIFSQTSSEELTATPELCCMSSSDFKNNSEQNTGVPKHTNEVWQTLARGCTNVPSPILKWCQIKELPFKKQKSSELLKKGGENILMLYHCTSVLYVITWIKFQIKFNFIKVQFNENHGKKLSAWSYTLAKGWYQIHLCGVQQFGWFKAFMYEKNLFVWFFQVSLTVTNVNISQKNILYPFLYHIEAIWVLDIVG